MSDSKSTSNRKSQKRKMEQSFQNRKDTRPHHNGAIISPTFKNTFTLVRPQDGSASSGAPSTSISNAAFSNSQVGSITSTSQNSKPTCSAQNVPSSFAASKRTVTYHGNTKSNRDSSAVASTSGQSSSGQKTFSSFNVCQTSVSGVSKYLAIDCEMVGVGPKGHISQLARCSIVSYDGDVVYDKFVKPSQPVTDYRTRWSGIRRCDLIGAMPYAQARKEILKLLNGRIVIGHAIHNDLKVLAYSHPKALIRDTSRIPLLNSKAGFPENQIISLKRLTKAIFDREIQTGKRGHSSVEDAKATMQLYRVIEEEWERELASSP